MPTVKLQPFGTLRALMGGSQLEFQLEPTCTLGDLLKLAAERCGKGFLESLIDPEDHKLREMVHLFVNGEHMRHLKGLDTLLADGDVVTILRADMAGGR